MTHPATRPTATGADAHPFALSIVVPVYNGAKSIGILVDALAGLDVPGGHEIVLVNDGSPDDSYAVCLALTERTDVPVTLVNLARNFGEHNAVMAGLAKTRGAFVITMDDDLQNPPEEVIRLFLHTRDNGYDVVYTYYAEKKHAWWRNLGSRFTNACADVLLDKPKGLYLSSFRCMSAFAVAKVVEHVGPYPYVDGLLLQVTQSIGRLQVSHLARAEGRSNYTLARLVRLWAAMFLNFSVMPLRVSAILGFVISGLGVLGFLIIFYEWLAGRTPTGYASIASSIVLISGVQLVMLGLIGEYLGRMFLTANGKPQYVVRTVHPPNATSEPAPAPAGRTLVPAGETA